MDLSRIYTCVCSLLLHLCINGQLPPMHHYDASNGLINNVVYQVDQDAFGRIWLGTEGGVSIFNGSDFIGYSVGNGLSSNTIIGFGPQPDGGMHVMHYARGMDHIHPNGTITDYAGFNFPISFGLIVDSTAFMQRMPSNVILSAKLPLNKKLNELECPIILRDRQIISRFAGKTLFCSLHSVGRATANGILPVYTDEKKIYAATEDVNGQLCVLREDGLFNTVNQQLRRLDKIQLIEVNSMLLDPMNRVWAVIAGKLFYDSGNGTMFDLSAALGLDNNTINSIFRDGHGNIWAATSGKGVYCFYSPYITTYAGDSGVINNTVTAVEPGPNGSILFGTRAGLSVLDSNGVFHNSTLTPYIYNIQHINGRNTICGALLTTQNELVMGISTAWLPKSCQLTVGNVHYSSAIDRITRSTVDGDVREINLQSRLFMASDRVEVMRMDSDGNLWVGARSGLYIIDSSFTTFRRLNAEFALLANHIHDICLNNYPEEILVAADGGILRKSQEQWTILGGENAPWEVVFSIQNDRKGMSWIGTDKGIFGLNNNGIDTHFSLKNGLSGFRVLDIWLDDFANVLWAGTDDGITRIDLTGWKTASEQVTTILMQSIAGNALIPGDHQTVLLEVGQTAFNIRFRAVNFNEPAMISYAYRLDESGDTLFTNEPSVFLQGLSYGEHDFFVQARKAGKAAGPVAHLRFFIPKPYYLQWWFMTIIILAGAAMFTMVIRWRFKVLAARTRRKLQVKEQLIQLRQQALAASINPHFIFNALNSIQYLVGENENDKAHDYIAKLGKLIRANLESMRNGFTTIELELVRLHHYFELEQLRAGEGIKLSVEIEESFRAYRIPIMILQPFVENAIWHGLAPHGGNGVIRLKFEQTAAEALIITIEDDGVGLIEASAIKRPGHNSIGVKTIAERLDLLNGGRINSVISIDRSAEGQQGTRVTLTLLPGCYDA